MDKRIKKIRRELDLTQQEFGDRIGVKRNTIATYEGGRSTPIDSVISLICREFNVNEIWLRTGQGEMFKAAPNKVLDSLAEEYGLTHGEYVLIEKFVKLKAEKRAAVVDYILEAAAAMQGEGADPEQPAILDSETATDEEKMEAYRDYLEGKKEKRREAN